MCAVRGLFRAPQDLPVFTIPVLNEVNGCRILSDLPEVGVVQTKDGTNQNFADDPMRNEDKGLSRMISDELLHCSHRPHPDIIQAFSTRESDQMGRFHPLSIGLHVTLPNLLMRTPFPLSKAHIDDSLEGLNL